MSRESHKEARRTEILNACEKIYREQGFYGVTMKEISTQTSFSRPAIYNYFETKDEVLLALLVREYEVWCEALSAVREQAVSLSRRELAESVAHTLDGRETLLRIQNMNLFEIEQNSRVERLAQFKQVYAQALELVNSILGAYQPLLSDAERESVSLCFSSFLMGVYPFVYHTEKQVEAMRMAGLQQSDSTIFEMVFACLVRLLPGKEEENL